MILCVLSHLCGHPLVIFLFPMTSSHMAEWLWFLNKFLFILVHRFGHYYRFYPLNGPVTKKKKKNPLNGLISNFEHIHRNC